jgi:phospholipid transport system substrate-binding protein
MKRRSFLPLFLAFPAAGFCASSTSAAEARLRSAIGEVLAVAERVTSRSALAITARSILQRHVSFETMTRRAVGVGWRQFKTDQQKRATELFTTLVIRTYSDKFTPGEHPVINYKNAVAPAPGRVDVPTTLVYKGSHYAVTYRMEEIGGWKIADVIIEGVSLIANYRSQLDSTFKQGGASAVIRSLEQSVARPS